MLLQKFIDWWNKPSKPCRQCKKCPAWQKQIRRCMYPQIHYSRLGWNNKCWTGKLLREGIVPGPSGKEELTTWRPSSDSGIPAPRPPSIGYRIEGYEDVDPRTLQSDWEKPKGKTITRIDILKELNQSSVDIEEID